LFPTAETIATASAAGIRITWSQNAAHKPHLMSVLSDGLSKKEWRLACVPSEDSVDQHYFVLSDSKLMIGGIVFPYSKCTL
jgi:hypothetical protein